jgi:hypothetical protein
MRIFILICGVIIVVIGLSIATIEDYLHPIGPADFRVQWLAYREMASRYGTPQHSGVEILSFDGNSSGKTDGDYKIRFYSDSHHGYFACHYDAKTGDIKIVKIDEK